FRDSLRAGEIAKPDVDQISHEIDVGYSEWISQAGGKCLCGGGIVQGLVRVAEQPFVDRRPSKRVVTPKGFSVAPKIPFETVLDTEAKVFACYGQISKTETAKSLRVMCCATSLQPIEAMCNFEHLIGQEQGRSQLTPRKRACP